MNEVLYNTEYLQLKSTISEQGEEWVYAHRPNAKNVVAILPFYKDEVLFLIEKRPPLIAEKKAEFLVSLPAGLVGDENSTESTIEALHKELKEETGCYSDNIKIVSSKIASSGGCVSETITLAIAEINSKEIKFTPQNDGGIIIDRIWVKKQNILNWLKEKEDLGYAISSQVFAGLFYFYNKEDL